MTLSYAIGNLVWQFRRRIISALVFASGAGIYVLARPYLVACGGGKQGLGAKLITCALAWMSGR